VLPPPFLVPHRPPELRLRLPDARDPHPVLDRVEPLPGLLEGHEPEVEAARPPVQGAKVQEGPARALTPFTIREAGVPAECPGGPPTGRRRRPPPRGSATRTRRVGERHPSPSAAPSPRPPRASRRTPLPSGLAMPDAAN